MAWCPIRRILDAKGEWVESVSSDAPVIEAIHRMNDRRIGSVLVTDGDSVTGIFSERDALVRVLAANRPVSRTGISEVMTRDLVCLAPDTSVEEAMHVATETRCRHLPVFDGQRLCGLVSTGDLVKWQVRDQRLHIEELIRYITS